MIKISQNEEAILEYTTQDSIMVGSVGITIPSNDQAASKKIETKSDNKYIEFGKCYQHTFYAHNLTHMPQCERNCTSLFIKVCVPSIIDRIKEGFSSMKRSVLEFCDQIRKDFHYHQVWQRKPSYGIQKDSILYNTKVPSNDQTACKKIDTDSINKV